MKPEGKFYKDMNFRKRWERIDDRHYLIPIKVSRYIRKLEKEIEKLKEK